MGFDLYGAGMAAKSLVGSDNVNQSLLPYSASKSIWSTQIQGAYSLLYPYMHTDYSNRDETNMAIKLAFRIHDRTNMHFGQYSTPGNTMVPDIPLIPRERIFSIGTVPTKSTNIERQTASSMEAVNMAVSVKADSPITSYGV